MADRRVVGLRRLLKPRHIAVYGGEEAAEVVRQCDRIGFEGEIWPVNPRRDTVEGRVCYRSTEALPAPPDAALIAVPPKPTVDIVEELAHVGAGGAVCYASGFSEAGETGAVLQHRLAAFAGSLAVVGPNCYGLLNYFDGVALWPDQHGGDRIQRGVAVVCQSGNIGLNISLQRRSLPLGLLITTGNNAALKLHHYIDVLVEDPRVTAIGLYIEGLEDVSAFSQSALAALAAGKPIVAIKTGQSELGAAVTLGHTSSLAGSDELHNALFERVGISRVNSLTAFLEALKLLSFVGPLSTATLTSMSCSGGEASLIADLAHDHDLTLPSLEEKQVSRLKRVLGDRVEVRNPLDYHTYIWGDEARLTDCFTAMLDNEIAALNLLALDYPDHETLDTTSWQATESAIIAACVSTGAPTAVVSNLPENLPRRRRERLAAHGVVPMMGLNDCMSAVSAAAKIGCRQAEVDTISPVAPITPINGDLITLDEWQSKSRLSAEGITVPEGSLASRETVVANAETLGFPVALKAVSEALVHKTEVGAVRLNLKSAQEVSQAVEQMSALSDVFLVETMVDRGVAEFFIGVVSDDQFGSVLVVGSGGTQVELLADTRSMLLPVTRGEIAQCIQKLHAYQLLVGFRGGPAGDLDALLDTIESVADYAAREYGRLAELDLNPVIVRPKGFGVVVADAMIRQTA